MSKVTIEVNNDLDLQLLLLLIKRLDLKLIGNIQVEKQAKKDLSHHLKIIEAGVDMSENRLNSMLNALDEGREDRILPNRNS